MQYVALFDQLPQPEQGACFYERLRNLLRQAGSISSSNICTLRFPPKKPGRRPIPPGGCFRMFLIDCFERASIPGAAPAGGAHDSLSLGDFLGFAASDSVSDTHPCAVSAQGLAFV